MKILFIYILSFVFGTQTSLTTEEVKKSVSKTADVYQIAIDVYLHKFVRLQYGEATTQDQKVLEYSLYQVFLNKSNGIEERLLNQLTSGKEGEVSVELINDSMERMYRSEFPGLDKVFFEIVKKELSKK